MLEGSVGKGEQILIAQMWKDLAARAALPRSLDEVGFRTFSQFDEDGILLYIFSVIGITNRLAIEMAAGVGYESNTANLIVNHNFCALLFEGNPETASQCRRFYQDHRDTQWNVPVEVDQSWLTAENINQLIDAHGFSGEIDLFSLDVDGMDYWLLKNLTVVQPRVIVLEYNAIFESHVAMAAAYEPDFVAGEGRADGASLAAFDHLCKKMGYRLIGCNRNFLNAFYVQEKLAKDVFPEVSIEDCLRSNRYPWWKKGGTAYETWMRSRGNFPNWVEIPIDVEEESKTVTADSLPKIPVLPDHDEPRTPQEIEVLITKIRRQIRERNMGEERSSPRDTARDYQFGERLDFGSNGKGHQYLGTGWHVAEAAFTWSDSLHASLHFCLPVSKADLLLEITASGYTNSKINHQDVIIEINGIECCRLAISKKYTFSIIVPKSVHSLYEYLVVRFTCPNRASPSHFKKGTDPRVLGIALHSLAIRENEIHPVTRESKLESSKTNARNGFDQVKR
jgi:hypothetical protein